MLYLHTLAHKIRNNITLHAQDKDQTVPYAI